MSQDYEKKEMNIAPKHALLKPASWLAQVDFINHLLLFNNVMLVALAEKKGGKSTYVEFLSQQLSDTFDIYQADCSIPFNEADITSPIASQLNLAKPEKVTMANICQQVNERHHHTLIILDDAHNLPETSIRKLLDVVRSQKQTPYFHLLLISDYSLLPYLNELSHDDAKDEIHSIEIGPFANDEIKTYLHQKVQQDRFKALINSNTCGQFYQLTKGVISRMNREIDPFFSMLTKSSRKAVKKFGLTVGIAASLLAGIVSVQVWQHPDVLPDAWRIDKMVSKKGGIKLKEHAALSNRKATIIPSRIEEVKIAPSQIASIPRIMPEPLYPSTVALIDQAAFKHQTIKPIILALNTDTPHVIRPELSDLHRAKKSIPDTTLKVKAKVTPSIKITNQDKIIKSRLVRILSVHHQVSKQHTGTPKYTIQLVATHQLKFLKAMLAKHPVHLLKVYTYPVKQEGDQWYVLTAGRFSNWSEAHDALAKLPKEYQVFHPWIRPIDKA